MAKKNLLSPTLRGMVLVRPEVVAEFGCVFLDLLQPYYPNVTDYPTTLRSVNPVGFFKNSRVRSSAKRPAIWRNPLIRATSVARK